jgi:hypothetical protein
MKFMRRYLWLSLISLALVSVGCSRLGVGARTDSQIATDVQGKINGDNNLPDKQITINANQGVVTLSGNVSSDAARSAAASDAAQVQGVKTVVNNLEVNPGATSASTEQQQQPEQQASNQPAPAPEPSRPSPRRSTRSSRSHESNSNTSDNGLRTTVPPNGATTATSGDNTASNNSEQATAQPTPPPPPQKVTIPSGTQIAIRLGQELNSETAQVGDVFHGSISTPIMVGDQMVVPTSADVEGRVVDVKSAGRFKGQSDLVLELSSLLMNGKRYNLSTNQWSKAGSGRGKATAAKVGGGAALGAILGGVFGGGKGAAIGAAAGAGAGTGVSAATKGQQIDLKPETVLNFQLQNAVSVIPGSTRQAMNQ